MQIELKLELALWKRPCLLCHFLTYWLTYRHAVTRLSCPSAASVWNPESAQSVSDTCPGKTYTKWLLWHQPVTCWLWKNICEPEKYLDQGEKIFLLSFDYFLFKICWTWVELKGFKCPKHTASVLNYKIMFVLSVSYGFLIVHVQLLSLVRLKSLIKYLNPRLLETWLWKENKQSFLNSCDGRKWH